MILLLKKAASWLVVLFGLALGTFAVAALDNKSDPPDPWYVWLIVVAFAVAAFILLIGSLTAITKPRTAATMFLFGALVSFVCFVASDMRYGLRLSGENASLAAFLGALLFIPGIFWLVTTRWRWPVLMVPSPERATRVKLYQSVAFILLTAMGIFGSLYMPTLEGDCSRERPPFAKQQFESQEVFTGKIVFVGRPLFSGNYSDWAVAKVEREFWGVRPFFGFVVVKAPMGVEAEGVEYFFDGRHGEGVWSQFLPVTGFSPCTASRALVEAEPYLRVLQDGPPKDGARIIGTVLNGRKTVAGIEVRATGPSGEVSVSTDSAGVYDFKGLPPGHYSISTVAAGKADRINEEHVELEAGEVWGRTFYLR